MKWKGPVRLSVVDVNVVEIRLLGSLCLVDFSSACLLRDQTNGAAVDLQEPTREAMS